MRPDRRLAAGLLVVLALAVPAVSAGAADDPVPPAWPTIAVPEDGDGGSSDPQPEVRPTVVPPQLGSAEDPTPPDWPAPSPG